VRAWARVKECPGNNTDYSASAAWAFATPSGAPVLAVLTAMKLPLGLMSPRSGSGGVGPGAREGRGRDANGGVYAWEGRLEVRCGSVPCLAFVQSVPGRLVSYITNQVFVLST
ncbi:unnamed protein product, partial [Discosporangium mesarthrocarpum]